MNPRPTIAELEAILSQKKPVPIEFLPNGEVRVKGENMSFLSSHIANETGTNDPVTGPNSPHADAPHHGKPGGAAAPAVLTSGGNPAPEAPEEDSL